jgi:CDP-glucose 4,6-dehydratase
LEQEFMQDIREIEKLTIILDQVKPDYIFHLAAQALVQESVADPIGTIATNVLGTSNLVYEALKHANLSGITVVTTDKVYENEEYAKSFKENDKLGGTDPYSASKAATELVTHALVMSSNPHQIPVTTVRAGNVIGGGDWASSRLIPDIIRAVESKEALELRNKNATRPFQHVLDCLLGYLLVAQTHISQTNLRIFDSYNFGPDKSLSVSETIYRFTKIIGDVLQIKEQKSEVKEHIQLHLDSTKAKIELNWLPSYSPEESVNLTASWYIQYLQGKQASNLMLNDLSDCRGFKDAMQIL